MPKLIVLALLALFLGAPARGQGNKVLVLTGQLELPDGSPAAGATVNVRGWQANSQRKQKYGLPKNWSDPDPVTADEEGRFRLEFEPHPAYQFVLRASYPDYPEEGWRWSELPAGIHKDLGTVTFQPPCYVVGYVQGEDGTIYAEGWRILGSSREKASRERSAATLHASPDSETGEFRIGPFPPGKVELWTRSDLDARAQKKTVVVSAEAPTRVTLLYTGPPLDGRIVFKTFSRPYYTFHLEGRLHFPGAEVPKSQLVLLGGDGQVLQHARHVAGTSQDWEYTDVPQGEYTVELRDPRFLPQRFEAVSPGRSYRLHLVGSAQLELEVLDIDGEPLTNYGLWVGYENVSFSPNEFEVQPDGSPAPQGGLVKGVVPGEILIELRGPNGTRLRRSLGRVGAGETKQVRVQFGAGQVLRGTVRMPNGEPATGVVVEYTQGPHAGRSDGLQTMIGTQEGTIRIGGPDGQVTTDGEGRFAIDDLQEGKWSLRAIASAYAWASATVDTGQAAEAPALTLPQLGVVEGHLKLPPDTGASQFHIAAKLPGRSPVEAALVLPGDQPKLAADGSFRIEGLPQGAIRLVISQQHSMGDHSTYTTSLYEDELKLGDEIARFDLDLQMIMPGSCRVNLRASGEPLEGIHVVAYQRSSVDESNPDSSRKTPFGIQAVSDSSGTAVLSSVLVERSYLLVLTDAEGQWIHVASTVEPLSGGEEREITLDLELVERIVQVLDSEGQPAANLALGWACDGLTAEGCRGKTDGNGRLKLRMPKGIYELFGMEPEEADGAPLQWEEGEDLIVVKLP